MDGDRRLIVNSGANRTTTTDPNFCFTSGLLSAADACLSRFPGLPGVDYNGAVVNRLLPNPLTPQHLMSPGASWSPAKPAQLPHHYRMDQNPQALLNHFGSTQAFLQTLWGTTTNGTNYNQRLPPSLKPPERDSLMINSPQFLGHGDGRPFFQQSSQVPLGNLPSTQRHTHLEPQYQHGQMIQQQQIQQKIMGDMNRTELPPNSPATANDRSVPQSNERSPLVRSANSHSSSTASPLTMRSSSGTPATLNQSNESLQQQQHNHQYQQQNYQSPQASMSSQESSPVLRTHSSMSNSNNTEAQESTKGGFSGHFQQQSNNGDRIMFSPGAQVNPQRSQQRLMQNFQPGNASSGFYPFKIQNDIGHLHHQQQQQHHNSMDANHANSSTNISSQHQNNNSFNSFFNSNVDPSLSTLVDEAISALTGKDASLASLDVPSQRAPLPQLDLTDGSDKDTSLSDLGNSFFFGDLDETDNLSLVLNDALGDTNSLIHSALEFDLSSQQPSTSSQISPGNTSGNRSGSANHQVTPKLREKIKRKEREIAEIDRELQRHLNLVAERDGPNNNQQQSRTDCFSNLPSSSGFLMSPTSESQQQSLLSPYGLDKPSTSDSHPNFKQTTDNSVSFTQETSMRFSPVRFSPMSDDESDEESTSKTSTPAISRFSCFKQKPEDGGTKIFIPIPDLDSGIKLIGGGVREKSVKSDTNSRGKRVPIYKQMSQLETTKSYLTPKKSQVLTLSSPGTPSVKNSLNKGGDSPYSFTDDEDTTSVAEILKEKSLEEEVSKKLAEISSVHPELKIAVLKQKSNCCTTGISRSSTPFDRSHSVMSTDSRPGGGRNRLDSQMSSASGYGKPQQLKSPSKGAVKMFSQTSPVNKSTVVAQMQPKIEVPLPNTIESSVANEMWKHIVPKKRHSAAGMTSGNNFDRHPPSYNNAFCQQNLPFAIHSESQPMTMSIPTNLPSFPPGLQAVANVSRAQNMVDHNSIDSAITSVLSKTIGTDSEVASVPSDSHPLSPSTVSNSVSDAVSSVLKNVLGASNQPLMLTTTKAPMKPFIPVSYATQNVHSASAAAVPAASDLTLISESPTSSNPLKPQAISTGDAHQQQTPYDSVEFFNSRVHNETEVEAELSVEAQIRSLLRSANEEKLQRRLDFMGASDAAAIMPSVADSDVTPLPVFGAAQETPATVSAISTEPVKPTLLLRISKQVLSLMPTEEVAEEPHHKKKKKKKHKHKHRKRHRHNSSESEMSDSNPFAGRLIVIENDYGEDTPIRTEEIVAEEEKEVDRLQKKLRRKEKKNKRRKHRSSTDLPMDDSSTQSAPETDLFTNGIPDEEKFEGFREEDLILVAGLPPNQIDWDDQFQPVDPENTAESHTILSNNFSEETVISKLVEDSDEDVDIRKLEIDESDNNLVIDEKTELVEETVSAGDSEDSKKVELIISNIVCHPKKNRLLGAECQQHFTDVVETKQTEPVGVNESEMETLHEPDAVVTSVNLVTESSEIPDRSASQHSFVPTSLVASCSGGQMLAKGSFIVAQDDITINDCPLWRVDNQNLLQKFVPVDRNGVIVYQSTATYSGWCNEQAYRYMSVTVRFLEQSKNHALVQLETPLEDLIPAISTEISDSVEACGLSPPECDQNGETRGTPPPDQPLRNALDAYLHALVLHAISRNFLQRISVEWEFTRHIEDVESVNLEKKAKLLSSVVWQTNFKENLDWYPFLSVSETDSSGLLCQACNGRYVEASVQLYGDPYNLETLQPRPHKSSTSGSPIPSQEFHCCSVCSDLAESYHRLYHMKYSLFRKCEDKVELIVEEAGKNLEPAMVTEQCLRNRTWVHSVVQEYIDQWQRIC